MVKEQLEEANKVNSELGHELNTCNDRIETLQKKDTTLVRELEQLKAENKHLSDEATKLRALLKSARLNRKNAEDSLNSCRKSQEGLRHDVAEAVTAAKQCEEGQSAAPTAQGGELSRLAQELQASKAGAESFKKKWHHALDVAEDAREAYQKEFNTRAPV